LLRGACHRARILREPLARNDGRRLFDECRALNHWQASRLRSTRECLVQRGEFVWAQRELACGRIVGGVFCAGGLWYCKDLRLPGQEAQGDLSRRGAAAFGDGLEHFASLAARAWKIVVTERRIRHHRDAMFDAPRDHRVLDRAFLQMIKHLVACDLALARDTQDLVEVVGVEIADAPCADFSVGKELFERRDRFGKRIPRQCRR
jgi:hypothetical protein